MGKVSQRVALAHEQYMTFASATAVDMAWWAGKDVIKEYLKQVNKSGKAKT